MQQTRMRQFRVLRKRRSNTRELPSIMNLVDLPAWNEAGFFLSGTLCALRSPELIQLKSFHIPDGIVNVRAVFY
jgi:hypothetical protein